MWSAVSPLSMEREERVEEASGGEERGTHEFFVEGERVCTQGGGAR